MPERTDIAALGAAVVAGALAMAVTQGPFDALGSVFALSLVALVAAYAWDSERGPLKSTAIGMIIALLLIQPVGFLIEYNQASPDNKALLLTQGRLKNCPYPDGHEDCKNDDRHSDVNEQPLLVAWVTMTLIITASDRAYQKRRLKS